MTAAPKSPPPLMPDLVGGSWALPPPPDLIGGVYTKGYRQTPLPAARRWSEPAKERLLVSILNAPGRSALGN